MGLLRASLYLSSIVGLPLVAWWLSKLFLPDPPLVAPFLLASPWYAMTVAGAIFSIKQHRLASAKRKEIPGDVISEVTAKHSPLFDGFHGKIALIADEDFTSGARIWMGWLYLDERLWKNLSPVGREFLLVRAVARGKDSPWWSFPLRWFAFLAAFMLACLNLWLIIVLHIAFVVGCLLFGMRQEDHSEEARDRVALAISENYEGARQYLTTIKMDSNQRRIRLAALKASAVEFNLT